MQSKSSGLMLEGVAEGEGVAVEDIEAEDDGEADEER